MDRIPRRALSGVGAACVLVSFACAGFGTPSAGPPEDDLVIHEAETGLLADGLQPLDDPQPTRVEPEPDQAVPQPELEPETPEPEGPEPVVPEPLVSVPAAPEPVVPKLVEPEPALTVPEPLAVPEPAVPEPIDAPMAADVEPPKVVKHPIGPEPDGITQLGPRTWRISAALFERIDSRPATLGRLIDEGNGWRLHGLRPRHGYHLGLRNRDVLLRVNGRKLRTKGQLESAYSALRTERRFHVLLERRGQERTHTYIIEDPVAP